MEQKRTVSQEIDFGTAARRRVSVGLAMTIVLSMTLVLPTSRSVSAACTVTQTLQHEQRNNQVLCLEQTLQSLGYQSSYVDGYFGTITIRSVKKYQGDNGLNATGIADAATTTKLGIWAGSSGSSGGSGSLGGCAVVKVLSHGMSGCQVVRLEARLRELGFQSKWVDDFYGTYTRDTGVKAAERSFGLRVDGVADVALLTKLGIWEGVDPTPLAETRVIGTTLDGRDIVARRYGNGPKVVLAAGSIHGNETGMAAMFAQLKTRTLPSSLTIWTIEVVNPDGVARGQRGNAHGIDLNRNFPSRDWRQVGTGTRYYSGTAAASEPETTAVMSFVSDIKPVMTLWWHQVGNHVDDQTTVANRSLLSTYASTARISIRHTSCGTPCVGNATVWGNETVAGSSAFVVELPSTISASTATTHVDAFLAAAKAA